MGMYDFANFVAPAPHPGEHLRGDYLPRATASLEWMIGGC